MKIVSSIFNSIITNEEKYYKEIKDNIDTNTSLLFSFSCSMGSKCNMVPSVVYLYSI